MKIGGDHERRLGETLRDRIQSFPTIRAFHATREESHYPSPRGVAEDVGVWACGRLGVGHSHQALSTE